MEQSWNFKFSNVIVNFEFIHGLLWVLELDEAEAIPRSVAVWRRAHNDRKDPLPLEAALLGQASPDVVLVDAVAEVAEPYLLMMKCSVWITYKFQILNCHEE